MTDEHERIFEFLASPRCPSRWETHPTWLRDSAPALFGFAIDERDDLVFALFEQLTASDDPAASYAAWMIVWTKWYGTHDVVPGLMAMLRKTTHMHHEDIVFALQQLRDARAIEVLAEVAVTRYAYLHGDDYPLWRKCMWALAWTGAADAKSKLEQLARSADPEVVALAHEGLENWAATRGAAKLP